MLRWALIFLVIGLIAGFFGFFSLEGVAMEIARVLFFLFVVIFVLTLLFGARLFRGGV